jgi:hypothetical protein
MNAALGLRAGAFCEVLAIWSPLKPLLFFNVDKKRPPNSPSRHSNEQQHTIPTLRIVD